MKLEIFAIGSAVLGTFAYASIRGAPWIPTFPKDVDRFCKLADIQLGQKVYDLGCGDGRIIQAASKQGANAVGLEVSILPYVLAKLRLLFSRSKSGHVKYRDFWSVNLNDADLVYFFLMPEHYPKLKKKLENELKPGAKVIVHVWPIDGWVPKRVDEVTKRPKLYLYEMSCVYGTSPQHRS